MSGLKEAAYWEEERGCSPSPLAGPVEQTRCDWLGRGGSGPMSARPSGRERLRIAGAGSGGASGALEAFSASRGSQAAGPLRVRSSSSRGDEAGWRLWRRGLGPGARPSRARRALARQPDLGLRGPSAARVSGCLSISK